MKSLFSSPKAYPITLKPITPAKNAETYDDIFNLLNTLRSVFNDLDKAFDKTLEEAPTDGKLYGRQNKQWIEVTGGGTPGPGPGPSAAGGNVYITGNPTGSFSNNLRGYTVICRLPGYALLTPAAKWKCRLWFRATGNFTAKLRLLTTQATSTTVTQVDKLKIGGTDTPTITVASPNQLFYVEIDPAEIQLSADKDYYLTVFFPSSNTATIDIGLVGSSTYVLGNYVANDQTEASPVSITPSLALLVSHITTVA